MADNIWGYQISRITHGRDPVVHLPLDSQGYAHAHNEIFYPDSMGLGCKYTRCNSNNPDDCSNAYDIDLNIEDHLIYYGIHVGTYCEDFQVRKDKDCGCFEGTDHDTCPMEPTYGYTCNPADNLCYNRIGPINDITLAESSCNYFFGGHTFSIHNAFENNYYANLDYFTTLPLIQGSTHWLDGSPVDYTNWAKDPNPEDITNGCVYMKNDGTWEIRSCIGAIEILCRTYF